MSPNFCLFALAVALGLFNSVVADNDDPVVLIHGVAAFAATWMYKREIEKQGLETIAFNVGKITSNWDRACEIYAQLKGTQVDFGVCHSREFGHARFGKDYTGQALFPEWDEDHRIHLWGHSMGGPTIRTLEWMLRDGSGCAEDTSPLFQGGKQWITSITTMSGVLDGTTLVDLLDEGGMLDFIKNLVLVTAGFMDNTFLDQIYEIDLEHWGLERYEGESFDDYWARVENSPFVDPANEDISTFDLSKEGTKKANLRGQLEYDDTYYFAFATERTKYDDGCKVGSIWCKPPHEEFEVLMLPFFWLTANDIGKNSPPTEQKNDGLVNWRNQLCPTREGEGIDRCKKFDGKNWEKGVWTWMDINYLDHLQMIFRDSLNDFFNPRTNAEDLYIQHAKRIKKLPSLSKP